MATSPRTGTDDRPAAPPAAPSSRPEDVRDAMAHYVRTVHRAYLSTGAGQPPAIRARMELLTGPITVVAAAARNLHVIATRETIAPPDGPEVALEDHVEGLRWTLRFLDPVVLPPLGLIDESTGPAGDRVRRAIGLSTHLYHLIVQPGSQLSEHHAGHAGAGLAMDHLAEARDLETIRAHARGAEALVDELEGATRANLPRAQALLARAIAPHDDEVRRVTDGPEPPAPSELRRVLLAAVRGPRP